MFTHYVLFWLKEGTPSMERDLLVVDCEAYLKKVPTVRHLWAGRPAMTPRDIVDNTYDVGLCVIFDDKAGHDVYQDHPTHNEFVARHKEYWKRVQVYDFA